ncbi:YdhK family protein [Paenibacillus hexagrammi]|uniref:YdhK family protein n=1 Tax=Paenibacillus hexagrammi TaxID=2908839 RepID=A0ABY3SNZ7_9BACL|nr:YdhK family protein [Paenibacillus sp. YPD9-1]UJF35658.1 YdhK family protein [Paenibacillus sp. YPD9-1]
MNKKIALLSAAVILAVTLSACGKTSNQETNKSQQETNHSGMKMDSMNHTSSDKLPDGMREADNPKFKAGSHAVIHTDHMPGMDGAAATIVKVYQTTVYAVSYVPTTGGEKVTNHKWVVQEEIKDAGNKPLNKGTEVTLMADHMPGMNGVKATIDSAEQTNVYIVDYTPTTGGAPVTNHKWVTESELSAK